MPGTVVRDALETDLLSGLTLTGTGTVTGSAVELGWTGQTTFVAETGTVTGTTPTMVIEVQGCESNDFSSSDVVTLGTISLADDDDAELGFSTYVDARYVRAVAVKAGTNPVYTGTTVKAVAGAHYHRIRGTFPTSEAVQ